jgi:hypothetical protein
MAIPCGPLNSRQTTAFMRLPLTDIPQMISKFVEIAPLSHRHRNGIPFAATRLHDFGSAFTWKTIRSILPLSRHTSRVVFFSLSIPSAYAGTGLRRRSSIRLKIFWNKLLGTATCLTSAPSPP